MTSASPEIRSNRIDWPHHTSAGVQNPSRQNILVRQSLDGADIRSFQREVDVAFRTRA
jgi:hypothetical protein